MISTYAKITKIQTTKLIIIIFYLNYSYNNINEIYE